jgi:hypothetical protein
MLPDFIKGEKAARRSIISEHLRSVCRVAKNMDLFLELVRDELEHVFKVSVPGQEHQRIHLPIEAGVHDFHDNRHVHLLLHFYLKALTTTLLTEGTVSTRAKGLLAFEGSDVDSDALLG